MSAEEISGFGFYVLEVAQTRNTRSPICYGCGEPTGLDYVNLSYTHDPEGPDADDICLDCATALATNLKRAVTSARKSEKYRDPQDGYYVDEFRVPHAPEPTYAPGSWTTEDEARLIDADNSVVLRFYNVPRVINGRRFKMARQIRGLSRLKLAQACGVNWWSIVDIENDSLPQPLPPQQVHALVSALRFPRAFFERFGPDNIWNWTNNSQRHQRDWTEEGIDSL